MFYKISTYTGVSTKLFTVSNLHRPCFPIIKIDTQVVLVDRIDIRQNFSFVRHYAFHFCGSNFHPSDWCESDPVTAD